jgi:hypothetical protein
MRTCERDSKRKFAPYFERSEKWGAANAPSLRCYGAKVRPLAWRFTTAGAVCGGRPSAKREKGALAKLTAKSESSPWATDRAPDARSAPSRSLNQPFRQMPRGLKTEHPTPSLPPSRAKRDTGGPRRTIVRPRGAHHSPPDPKAPEASHHLWYGSLRMIVSDR